MLFYGIISRKEWGKKRIMSRYIEFIAVENVTRISSKYDYIKSIYDKLVANGFINKVSVDPSVSTSTPICICNDEKTCFSIDYNSVIDKKSNI